MISRLTLQNYRAFDELDIELKKLNLFFGPNNSGKSSIMSVIPLLCQTFNSQDGNVKLLLKGDYEDLGSYYDVVHGNERQENITISIEFVAPEGDIKVDKDIEDCIFSIQFGYRPNRREIHIQSVQIHNLKRELIMETKYKPNDGKQSVIYMGKKLTMTEIRKYSKFIRFYHFIPLRNFGLFKDSKNKDIDDSIADALESLDSPLNWFFYLFHQFEYIGPFRMAPNRTYMFTGETPSTVGKHGERAIDILVNNKATLNKCSTWMKNSRIGAISIVPLTKRHFELKIKNDKTKELESLADTGYGCSQVLPIITAAYTLKSGSTFIVQQPEIHLHPSAQAELGNLFVDLANNGIQSFVETHSEHMLLRIQALIAEGIMDPKDVAIYYVYGKARKIKGKQTIKKIVKRLNIGDDGFFIDEWPEGFFPDKMIEVKRLNQAIAKRRK